MDNTCKFVLSANRNFPTMVIRNSQDWLHLHICHMLHLSLTMGGERCKNMGSGSMFQWVQKNDKKHNVTNVFKLAQIFNKKTNKIKY